MSLLLSAALLLAAAGPKPPLRILFIGNSHTQVNDVPALVTHLLESDGSGRKVETFRFFSPFLNDAFDDPAVKKAASDPHWNIVVLQGAKVSSSHKYNYPNDGAVALAKLARRTGSRALFFVEWPRQGWDESDYQTGIYRGISKLAPGSELVPVCYAWDSILKRQPDLNLWQPDGNHASPLGSFLASYVFYYYLAGTARSPSWVMPGISTASIGMIRAAAKDAVKRSPAGRRLVA
jgi:hypothetical protein